MNHQNQFEQSNSMFKVVNVQICSDSWLYWIFKIQKHVAAVSIVLCVGGLGSYRDNVFVK